MDDHLGLSAFYGTSISDLSRTRQKLRVVMALLTAPPLLLLDEVFSGLDIPSALELTGRGCGN